MNSTNNRSQCMLDNRGMTMPLNGTGYYASEHQRRLGDANEQMKFAAVGGDKIRKLTILGKSR